VALCSTNHRMARLSLCACLSRASHVAQSHLGAWRCFSALWALWAATPSAAPARLQAARGTVARVRRGCVLGVRECRCCRQEHTWQDVLPGLDQQRGGRCRGATGRPSLRTCRQPARARLHSQRSPSRRESRTQVTCGIALRSTSASLSLRLNHDPFGSPMQGHAMELNLLGDGTFKQLPMSMSMTLSSDALDIQILVRVAGQPNRLAIRTRCTRAHLATALKDVRRGAPGSDVRGAPRPQPLQHECLFLVLKGQQAA
jgi:hypothetical protein